MKICFVLLEKILGNYRLSKHNRVYFEIQVDLSINSQYFSIEYSRFLSMD